MKRALAHIVTATLLLAGAAAFAGQPVKIACIGDSITFGYGLQDPGAEAYPAVLQTLLGDGYEVLNFGFSARTMSLNGDRPYMKEEMYRQAKDCGADIVTIMLGTNDTKPWNWNEDDFEQACSAMLSELKRPASKLYICLPPAVVGEKWGINDSTIVHGVIPVLKKLARKNRIRVIDTHKATSGIPEHFPDSIHPDAEASEILAKTIYKAIR